MSTMSLSVANFNNFSLFIYYIRMNYWLVYLFDLLFGKPESDDEKENA